MSTVYAVHHRTSRVAVNKNGTDLSLTLSKNHDAGVNILSTETVFVLCCLVLRSSTECNSIHAWQDCEGVERVCQRSQRRPRCASHFARRARHGRCVVTSPIPTGASWLRGGAGEDWAPSLRKHKQNVPSAVRFSDCVYNSAGVLTTPKFELH